MNLLEAAGAGRESPFFPVKRQKFNIENGFAGMCGTFENNLQKQMRKLVETSKNENILQKRL